MESEILVLFEERKYKDLEILLLKSKNQRDTLCHLKSLLEKDISSTSLYVNALLRATKYNKDVGLQNYKMEISLLILEKLLTTKSTHLPLADVLFIELDYYSTTQLLTLLRIALQRLNEFNYSIISFEERPLECVSKIISLLGNKVDEDIESSVDDEKLKGPEYKTHIIQSLCLLFTKDNLSALLSMFRNMTLSSLEWNSISSKVCFILTKTKVPPSLLPPLVYQYLHLSASVSTSSTSLLFLKALKGYFEDNSETETDVKEAFGTVIYHIVSVIKLGFPIGKDFLKLLKSTAPEIILNSFFVYLALATSSSVKVIKASILESLRATLLKNYVSAIFGQSSAWFSETLSSSFLASPIEIFSNLIMQTRQHGGWELYAPGLLDLALLLLDTPKGPFGKTEHKSKGMWDLGTQLLVQVVYHSSDRVNEIIKLLSNRIIYESVAPQYTNSLRLVIKSSFDALVSNASPFKELLEQLPNLGVLGGRRVLMAILPLVKYSRTLTHMTILILRKSLFAPSVETKQVAVFGVLLLLKYFRIKTLSSSFLPSSSSFTPSSLLSQFVSNSHKGLSTSNEVLCLELLGVLKRCFNSSSIHVRLILYQELHDVIIHNPELTLGILDSLVFHSQTLSLTSEGFLDLNSAFKSFKGTQVVVEPLGWFLHCLQSVVSRAEHYFSENLEEKEDEKYESLQKASKFLQNLIEKYKGADFFDLNLDKGADFSKQTPEFLRVSILKNIYEALLEYTIFHGFDVSEEKATLLITLCLRHSEISSLLKGNSSSSSKKKTENKMKEEGDKGDVASNAKNESPFPEFAFSFKALSTLLRSLLLDHNPAHDGALRILRQDKKWIEYFLSITKGKIRQVESSSNKGLIAEASSNSSSIKQMTEIGSLLFKSIVFDREADELTSVSFSLECLYSILQILLLHFPKNSESFFVHLNIGSTSKMTKDESLVQISRKLMDKISLTHDIMHEREKDKKENDGLGDEESVFKNLSRYFDILNLLLSQINWCNKTTGVHESLKSMYNWTKRYAQNNVIGTSLIVIKSVFTYLFSLISLLKVHSNIYLDIAKELHRTLGDLDSSIVHDTSVGSYPCITKDTAEVVFGVLYIFLDKGLETSELAISHLRRQVLSSLAVSEDIEASICQLFARLVNAAGELAQSSLSVPSVANSLLLKFLIKLYASAGNLSKYFYLRSIDDKASIQKSRFDKLVNIIGGNLTGFVYTLITALDKRTNEYNLMKNPKSSKGRPLNKETKTVPLLIFRIEAFEKELIKLSSKSEINLLTEWKASTARDFRFNITALNELLESDESEHENSSPVAQSTAIDNVSQNSVFNAGASFENSPIHPPKKKRMRKK